MVAVIIIAIALGMVVGIAALSLMDKVRDARTTAKSATKGYRETPGPNKVWYM